MDGKSFDIKQNNIETLRKLFPGIFSEGKIDPEKFKATFGDDVYFHNERYTLNWAGKADAFRILQERTTATLEPQPELSVNFDTTGNVFIEGENLEVLKVLQQGKVPITWWSYEDAGHNDSASRELGENQYRPTNERCRSGF